MLELVKMLQTDVESKAAEAQAAGKHSIAAWREVQTKQLLESFKADLQRLDFASLPQFKCAISSIGLAQQQLKLVSPALSGSTCSFHRWHRQDRSEAIDHHQYWHHDIKSSLIQHI